MRDIKFRMWGNDRGEYFSTAQAAACFAQQISGQYDHTQHGDVFEQYTGLHDKNGKEIYEGDIVHLIDHPENITTRADVVIFEHGNFTTASETAVPLVDYGMVWVEIIGNIHENQELLND